MRLRLHIDDALPPSHPTMEEAVLNDLKKKREQLRDTLKSYFALPMEKRNYEEFCKTVDSLDQVRKDIKDVSLISYEK